MKKTIAGWGAVALSAAFASLWAFWGSTENFHEGWYYESLWMNLGLMTVQYLLWSLMFMVFAGTSLRWPRIGGTCFLVAAALVPLLLIRGTAGMFIFALPLGMVGLLFLVGRPRPNSWNYGITVGVPLIVLIGSGIEPASRVAGRFDDGILNARIIEGNGVKLVWAPAGPGWPSYSGEFKEASWYDAQQTCRYLAEDGTRLAEIPQNAWRLPTVEEVVRSQVRHGSNAGGTWDSARREPSYKIMPDKESPLWRMHSPVVYWWTSTELNDSTAYRAVYNGGVQPLRKTLRAGSLGFRAVKELR